MFGSKKAEEPLQFTVMGSQGDLYDITASRRGDNFTFTCSCPAGQKRMYCKHRFALLGGDVTNLMTGDEKNVPKLVEMARGTDVHVWLGVVSKMEKELDEAKKNLAEAKKRLGQAMSD